MRLKNKISFLLLVIGTLGLSACSYFSKTDNKAGKSDKLTTPLATDNALRMGIKIHMIESDMRAADRIGAQLEKNLKKFDVCLKQLKTEIVRLNARWTLKKEGVFDNVKVISVDPQNEAFKTCFIKEINKLQFKTEPQLFHGQLDFATFWGTEKDWKEPKKTFEKPQ